jgi:hypothetical protein
LGVACGAQHDLFSGVQNGLGWVLVLLLDLGLGDPTDEDWLPVPDDLQDLSGRELRDIDLQIGIPIVALPAIHAPNAADGVEAGKGQEAAVVDGCQSVDLGPADVRLVLVVDPESATQYLLSLYQLSMLHLKSMWSPKLPGLLGDTKNCGFCGIRWVPLILTLAR